MNCLDDFVCEVTCEEYYNENHEEEANDFN